jgi:23S rRNA (pseudouridine1915-N3)-methyltransferase
MPHAIGHVTVVAVGRLKERHWQAAQDDYTRRLGRFTDFRLVEVRDAVGKSLPDAVALGREGEQLLAAVPKGARVILLAAGGQEMSSPELAVYLQSRLETHGDLVFLIGGPLGFDAAVIAAAHDQLALSRLTFPHELARILLLEQLYRAFTIMHGEPYHK